MRKRVVVSLPNVSELLVKMPLVKCKNHSRTGGKVADSFSVRISLPTATPLSLVSLLLRERLRLLMILLVTSQLSSSVST